MSFAVSGAYDRMLVSARGGKAKDTTAHVKR